MDSSASGTPVCPTCGEQPRADHACPPSAPEDASRSSFEDTGRIQIPEALRNTGLFRAAWKPSSEQASPETMTSVFARIEEEPPVSEHDDTPGTPGQQPEQPVDPWAGLDTVIVPPSSSSKVEDPWAHLSTPETAASVTHEAPSNPFAAFTPRRTTALPPEPTAAPVDETTVDPIWAPAPTGEATEPVLEEPAAQEPTAEQPEEQPGAVDPAQAELPEAELSEAPEAPGTTSVPSVSDEDVSPETATEATEATEAEVEVQPEVATDVPAETSAETLAEESGAADEEQATDDKAQAEAPDAEQPDAEPASEAAPEESTAESADESTEEPADAEARQDLTDTSAGLSPIAAAEAAATVGSLSPIAAAEAAAVAAGHTAPVEAPVAPVRMDETAAIDLEAQFAAEDAAAAGLEQVPEPDQSAWDLYGDSLYATDEPTTVTPVAGDPAEGDPFVPGLTPAGVTSASLPGSVPFAPGVGLDGRPTDATAVVEEEPRERRSRKGLVAGVAALALVAAGGGWFWWDQQKDAPVKDAFATSHTSFMKASTQLTQAASIADIAAAGAVFGDTVPELDATQEKSRESGSDVAVAARRAVVAQKAVAEAAAPLQELSSSDLSAWGSSKEALATSLEGLDDVVEDIRTAGGDTERLPEAEVVERLQEVIADEVVEGAAETVVDVSAKLEAATLLADVRAAGSTAGEYVTPLKEAAADLEDPEQQAALTAVVEFHEALSGFSKIRPATFEKWEGLRKDAEKAAKGLEEGKDEARAGIKAADALVTTARETFEKWESEVAEAKAENAADLSGLEAAAVAAESADTKFSALTDELAGLLTEVRTLPAEGTEGEAYSKLDAAASAREEIVTSLTDLTLTPGPAGKLEALLAVVTEDAEAVRALADAAGRCTDACRLPDSAAWKALGPATATSAEDWDTALAPFVEAIESATEKVKARELPERPKI